MSRMSNEQFPEDPTDIIMETSRVNASDMSPARYNRISQERYANVM